MSLASHAIAYMTTRDIVVQLETGGHANLGSSKMLWGKKGMKSGSSGTWPFPHEVHHNLRGHGLFRTVHGHYIVKEPVAPNGIGLPRPSYYEVTKDEAYSWLVTHSPGTARQLFPDEHLTKAYER
jgi:hypothetical protein